jgi:hypothetical protein
MASIEGLARARAEESEEANRVPAAHSSSASRSTQMLAESNLLLGRLYQQLLQVQSAVDRSRQRVLVSIELLDSAELRNLRAFGPTPSRTHKVGS